MELVTTWATIGTCGIFLVVVAAIIVFDRVFFFKVNSEVTEAILVHLNPIPELF